MSGLPTSAGSALARALRVELTATGGDQLAGRLSGQPPIPAALVRAPSFYEKTNPEEKTFSESHDVASSRDSC